MCRKLRTRTGNGQRDPARDQSRTNDRRHAFTVTGLQADVDVSGVNTLPLGVGNRYDQGWLPSTTKNTHARSNGFIKGDSVVMRHRKAEKSNRLRAIGQSRTISGWPNGLWV